MSHLAQIQTNIRSLDILRASCEALGIPIHPEPVVSSYYRTFNGEARAQVDLALGAGVCPLNNTVSRVGFRKLPNGTYEMLADPYDCNPQDLEAVLDRMGPSMRGFETVERQGISGHVATGKPTLLLQEYALQVGEMAAQARGMSSVRVPQPNGDKLLRITGGSLPPGGMIVLTSRVDGTSTVAAFNVKGPGCKAATKWLEDVLGVVTDDHLTSEFFHQTTSAGQVTHVR